MHGIGGSVDTVVKIYIRDRIKRVSCKNLHKKLKPDKAEIISDKLKSAKRYCISTQFV